MSRRRVIEGRRPPSYISKATLATELDMSESTVDTLVIAGVLPKPIKIGGSVRWNWAEVDAALVSNALPPEADPFLQGISNVS